MNELALAMTAGFHRGLRRHLFPGDGLEAAAVVLCNQGTGRRRRRLLAAEVLSVPHRRSNRWKDHVAWPFAEHLPPDKIGAVDRGGQSILTVHSHPDGCAAFSPTDDANDQELFASVCGWFDDGRPHGSAVMLPDGSVLARAVDADGTFSPMRSVIAVGSDIRIWQAGRPSELAAPHRKLEQTFGAGTLRLLRTLRVGVVGCSGTGSIVVELLARSGIGELVLVDDDVVEEKNLNRILHSTADDARAERPKVEAVKRAVEASGMGARVAAVRGLTDRGEAVRALVDCDAVFGCVDSARGRYHLDCLASAYLLPYFDVGVGLETDGEGGIEAADAVAHYVHPEGASLLSRHAYAMEQVTAENWRRQDPEHYRRQRVAGYLAAVGEEQPAVMSVNMQAACMAFNDFLARIHRFRLDGNREFGTQRFRLAHGDYERTADDGAPHPLLARYAGAGDRSLLVRNNILDD